MNGMKSDLKKKKDLNTQTGNISLDTLPIDIDEETRQLIAFNEEYNLPYHLENGEVIYDDIPEEYVSMTCKRCKKTHNMPDDIYQEMFEFQSLYNKKVKYLEIDCVYCNKGIMIPTEYIKK